MNKQTILLYGRTNAGKSAMIGELAEHLYKTLGKKTRLYTADRGGTTTIQPYIDLGIIEAIELGASDPWIFLNKAARGYVRDASGKWIPGKNDNLAMFAFESLTAFADSLMASMAKKAGEGVSIGGGANVSFNIAGDGENLKISGSNMAMYGVCQSRITEECWQSQKLEAPYIMWTASASKDDDLNSGGKVIGPALVGKALTAEIPRWFGLTFRIDAVPAQNGKAERHILYLGNTVDLQAGNATGLGNTRMPLDSPALTSNTIEPASLVKALQTLEGGYAASLEAIKSRLKINNVA